MIYSDKAYIDMPIIKKLKQVSEVLDRYEEAMKLNSMRMNLALKAINAGVWEWDLKNNIVKWDSTLVSLLGIDPKTLDMDASGWYISNFEKLLSLVHPDDKIHTREFIKECKENFKPNKLVFRITSKENNKTLTAVADTHVYEGGSLIIGICVPNDSIKE